MKKHIILLSIFVLFAAFTASSALAAKGTVISINPPKVPSVSIGITVAELGVENPGILPTSPFYFLKEWRRGISRFFTFNSVAKAELELKITNEKAAEALKVQETKPDDAEALATALENYTRAGERLQARLAKLKETSENPNVEKLLEKLNEQTLKHAILFNQLAGRCINDSKDDDCDGKDDDFITNAVKSAQKKISDTIRAGAEKDENIEQKAKEQIKRAETVINELESELAKFAIATDVDKPSVPNDKHAINTKGGGANSGRAAGGMLANATSRLALAKMAFAGDKFGEAFGQARSAEVLARNGLGIIVQDIKKPIKENQSAPSLETTPAPTTVKPIEGIFCTQEYNPVCGENGKTYSNECHAKLAGVAVKYKGECRPASIEQKPIAPTPQPTEQKQTATEPSSIAPSPAAPAFYEFKLEADDYGFYPESTITIPKGSRVKIYFIVRTSNVYYGGLDFRSSKFKTETVKPGGTTNVEFIADESFVFTSYWPLFGVQKISGKVIAE